MSGVAKFDVVALSTGWFYIGAHVGANNAAHWTIQTLAFGLLGATIITLTNAD